MPTFLEVLHAIYEVALQAAPWLVLGLVVAGLIHAFLPPVRMTRWLGGRGLGSIIKAALLGAPLPLCSCGVLPVAVGLRRAGASRGATASFMVSTPETGVDSISLTYAMMGPVYAIIRPVSAVLSAITAGLLVEWLASRTTGRPPVTHPLESAATPACCATRALQEPASCCTTRPTHDACAEVPSSASGARTPFWKRLLEGQKYASTRLIDDLARWFAVGIIVSGLMNAFIEPSALERWGSSPWAYLVMLFIGLPLYVCASAATPVAASLLLAGVAPGPVLVLLLAGPGMNMATLGVLRRELGARSIAPYLVGVGGVALVAGFTADALASRGLMPGVDDSAHVHAMGGGWLALACLIWLCFIALRPLRKAVFGVLGVENRAPSAEESSNDCCAPKPPEPVRPSCCSHS